MSQYRSHIALALAIILFPAFSQALDDVNKKASVSSSTKAAGCAPATGIRDMEWNNVRALIETGGSFWQNRSSSMAAYEVPKGGGVSAIYSGALWMGGLDPTNQLKIAALTFRTGNDFWTGPLTNPAAEVDENTCLQYDKFFVSYRQDIELHRSYFDCLNDDDCEVSDVFPDGYTIPQYFFDWPAHGNSALGQDYYLAPYYDYDGGGFEPSGPYNPSSGDYPAFDIAGEIECDRRSRETTVPLYGDFNMYWIFNDKGNIHTETQGEPIGMEIRAQAFAFNTNDEINNMTFYNYLMINQGSTTLKETYFGQWVDPDLGTATDDYVGCDVQRGLGYCINGDNFDEPSTSSPGYGDNPPAVGVDFFEGPFQDADGIANPLTIDYSDAIDSLGIPYEGIGIGYNDSIIDNERFGMRKFMYYLNNSSLTGNPEDGADYYALLTGKWPNDAEMVYGGSGYPGSNGATDIGADYMFPGDTDPYGWGTGGVPQESWTMPGSNFAEGDMRFIQSAGPFTLEPGARNNITVGVVWARAYEGDALASLDLLKIADDKAQALFDNCFEIIEGPDAPDVLVQELDREIILLLSNENLLSNNYQETYCKYDPGIPEITTNDIELTELERSYKFQGYQIYQIKDETVPLSELDDPEFSRLIYSTDIQDGIENLINYELDPGMQLNVPVMMAEGDDEGLEHAFRITHDAFALGDTRLVNHKTYHFVAIAYGHNEYEPYDPVLNSGQFEVYKASRKGAVGGIRKIKAIPHKVDPESGGTTIGAAFGDEIPVTCLEGQGNSKSSIKLKPSVVDDIMSGYPWKVSQTTYETGFSPVKVKVVEPLQLQARDFILKLNPTDADLDDDPITWVLLDAENGDTVFVSRHDISTPYEEVISDYGISIEITQHTYSDDFEYFTEFLSGEIDFENNAAPWYTGIPDQEGFSIYNWVRSGQQSSGDNAIGAEAYLHDIFPPPPTNANVPNYNDPDEAYENVIDGTWAPYCVTAYSAADGDNYYWNEAPREETFTSASSELLTPRLKDMNSVQVVFTPDRELWTRCPVLEMQSNPLLAEGGAEKQKLRSAASVDKYGKNQFAGGNFNEATLGGSQLTGMGWFPGYAIDLETGERLNMAFGEDSFMAVDNGNDMIWNPTHRLEGPVSQNMAGQHWIYVFKNTSWQFDDSSWMPGYDEGQFIHEVLSTPSPLDDYKVWKSCTWVGSGAINPDFPLESMDDGLIPQETSITLCVAQPYRKRSPLTSDIEQTNGSWNNWNPTYTFSTRNYAAEVFSGIALEESLACINVVPNPYYAYSEYETSKLDNRVKITNLPEQCTVSVYSINGTLVRQYKKADPMTSLDWDLKNHANVPIAGGVYLIHIDVPGVGERILKWFGVMRPTDLDNF